ncbi:MAG: hypothetical protein AW09_002466 [Candidatus Accumulibacter phosphatis]|uniref:Uncharacterized protein n=1 Tax=Candidatus Accumulibacter phosphatis TaxID=327160 RepID=A0A080LUQ4_9PROT|nr:MAG: hypothetical protein AW09_002466 [Candidatus Accumulibacter phosphatis]HCZ14281.1 hypothetical protein [Accumulibacter sp.]
MSAAELIEEAKAQGVILALSPDGTITATGEQSVVDCWLPIIRENKLGIIRALQRERRRTKTLAMLGADPRLRYVVVVDDASTDPVVVAVAIREVATFELEIPLKYYDALVLLELLEKHSAAEHRDA